MAPLPLEGAPMGGGAMAPAGQAGGAPPGGSIPLNVLMDFILQRTYHELTILAEL